MGRSRSNSRSGSSGRRRRGSSSRGSSGKRGGGGGDGSRRRDPPPRPRREGDLFDAAWLNEAMSEARGLKRMRKIEHGVSDFLVDHLRGQLDSQAKQQALFSLLGFGFVQRHFPHHKYDPSVLDDLSPEKRELITTDMKEFLDEKVRLGMEHYRGNNEVDRKLMIDLREIFSSDFQSELQKTLIDKRKIKVKHSKRRTKVVELEDTTEERSKFIEETLNDIIRNGPGIDELILSELASRVMILNSVFRHRLFHKLYLDGKREPEIMRNRKEYGDQIRSRLKELGITNVSDWQGRKAIDSSVILAYERSSALREEFESDFEDADNDGVDDRLVFFTRILSLAKMVDDNFAPTHIFWLTRASRYFPDHRHLPVNGAGGGGTREDRALTIAHYFKRFSEIAVYSKGDIFGLAQEVYDTLEQEETETLIKLNEAVVQGVEYVDLTLFSQDIIVTNPDKKNEIVKRFLKKRRVAREDLEHFADVRLFLRKWLSECFIGVMDRNGCSLVWDFLFLHKFSRTMSVNVCLALFHLLKPSFEKATDFRKVQMILLDGPKVLLIRDLRRVLQHFSRGGGYASIPGAPSVPSIVLAPPSARESDRKAKEKRIEALNQDFLFVDDD